MPELRLFPLEEVLEGDALTQVGSALAELGIERILENDDSMELDDALGEEQLIDFLDRLGAHEIACDVYLPLEFEGTFEAGDRTLGSSHSLLEALEELRDELNIDDPNDDDGEEDELLELVVIDEQLTHAWHVFAQAANASVTRDLPLHVVQ